MTDKPGYIYIMYNPSLRENLVKIGKTKRTAKIRAKELSRSTGVPGTFLIAKEFLVNDSDLIEKQIHKELVSFRYSKNKEFFEMSLAEAIDKVEEIISRYSDSDNWVLDNKWDHGKTKFDFSLLKEQVPLFQPSIFPYRVMIDSKKGSEVVLIYCDERQYLDEIIALEVFNFLTKSGAINTEYGPICFYVFAIKSQNSLKDNLVILDAYLNPYSPEQKILWRDLSRQKYWHLFILNENYEQLGFREIKNAFCLEKFLNKIDELWDNESPENYNFDLAKQEIFSQFTPEDLFML
jgi:hypothetical protein